MGALRQRRLGFALDGRSGYDLVELPHSSVGRLVVRIEVQSGDIAMSDAQAIIVNLFEGVKQPGGATGAVDRAMGGAISELIADGEIKGKAEELTLIHTLGRLPARRVLVAGLGKGDDFCVDRVRDLMAGALRRLRRTGVTRVATILHGAGTGGLDPVACARAVAEGAELGLYEFRQHRTSQPDGGRIDELIMVVSDGDRLGEFREAVEWGATIAAAVNSARDMANEPANHLTPTDMAGRARALAADAGLTCHVLERAEIEREGMGALLGVAAGSVQPPKFIVVRYEGAPASKRAIALLGKGITFDSGGISIKPSSGMEEMKGDMSGGGAVLSALWAMGKLKPDVNVTGIVPATENMPSGSATKPGDVVRAMNGKSIEVINTDAEGRLILADAICYAREQGLSPIIDVATLTGSMAVALGEGATGFLTTSRALSRLLVKAGTMAGERMWELPLIDEYREGLKSNVADIKNVGPRYGGAITAAQFLQEFAEDTPWLHIDMAPTDNVSKDKGVFVRGATGIPTRTLINLVLLLSEEMSADGWSL